MKQKEIKREKVAKNLKERGITLVALVVTIIILLILAGVTLNLTLNEGGLFSRTQTAVDKYKSAQDKEITQLGELEEILNEYSNEEIVPPTEKTYSVEDLKDKLSKGDGDDSVIGKKVEGLTGGVAGNYEWEIFYVDDNNIYLISKDYIKIADCPIKDNVSLTTGSTEYIGYWSTDLLNKYNGSSDITEEKIKNLNKDFFITKNYESSDNNMKATAYMLDTEIWKNKIVGNNDKVDYVIGGPSVELVLNAYNAKYGTNYGAKAYDESSKSEYSKGYKVSKDASKEESESDWQYYINYMLRNTDSTYDSTFVIESYTNAYGMWLASPSASYANDIVYVFCDGTVSGDGYDANDGGFRPVVSLNSNVQLEEIEGGYRIK